ncbi:hypothetical protein V493_02832 [Pseudogymnoascus sp. VKM F-4281 (FW-2241)]|nr:hypothetical protein V493_02832 [Pseudogymnoascus sp. VKM F-4281 (FW-2241)]
MAPFNHFGAVFSNPFPPVSPPSTKRSVEDVRSLRGFLAERAPNTSRDSKLRRRRPLLPRQLPDLADSAEVDSDSEDTAGVSSGEDSDDVPDGKGKGLLGDAIDGIGSVVDTVLDPVLGGQSSTAVAAPEETSAAEIASEEPTAIATTESESTAVDVTSSITSSNPSSDAVATSNPSIIFTTPTEHSSKLPDAPSPSDLSAVESAESSGVLLPVAVATPTPSKAAALTRFTPEFTRSFPTPTAQLQSADRASLANSEATGAAGQKAQGQAIDPTVESESDSDSDSDDGVESGDESDDELESDDEDEPTESRLVAFTTISGTPLSTLSPILNPTAVGTLPSSVTPVSQTGGQTTVASASANKPALTPEASNGLIAFGAIGGVLLFSFVVYFLLRLRKTDAFSCLNCCTSKRKSESIASKSLYNSGGVFGTAAPSETQTHSRGFSAFFNPMIQIRAAEYEKGSGQGQPYSRNSLIQNAAPIAASQQPMPSTRDDPPPMPTIPPAYRQAANGKSQRMSEASSLSSGFGDAVIDIPESGPTTYVSDKAGPNLPKPNNKTLGLDLGPRFSWANIPTPRTLGNHRKRDTVTTTTSQDSEPRFRTITSWVNQQTSRVMKNQNDGGTAAVPGQERDSVPDLPAIPEAYGGAKHKRISSAETDVVFKAHPGDEVEIKERSRIPSTLLTRKLRL